MSNPSLSVATRLQCCADDLEALRPFIPIASGQYAESIRVCRALREVAHRLEGLPSPAPTKQPTCVGDSSASAGAGATQ